MGLYFKSTAHWFVRGQTTQFRFVQFDRCGNGGISYALAAHHRRENLFRAPRKRRTPRRTILDDGLRCDRFACADRIIS